MLWTVLEFAVPCGDVIGGTKPEDQPLECKAIPYDEEALVIFGWHDCISNLHFIVSDTADDAEKQVLAWKMRVKTAGHWHWQRFVRRPGSDPIKAMIVNLIKKLFDSRMTQKEISVYLGISEKMVQRWCKNGSKVLNSGQNESTCPRTLAVNE